MIQKKLLLVTGGDSQTAETMRLLQGGCPYKIHYFPHKELDVTSLQSITTVLDSYIAGIEAKNILLINLAAYTAVDNAEKEPQKAYDINSVGVSHLADYALRRNFGILHLSTDYVFDGFRKLPYREVDSPSPLSIYGKSKLSGEKALQELFRIGRGMVIRTSWLYSPFGHNFFRTIATKLQQGDRLRVVDDQFGSPTSAFDLVRFFFLVADRYFCRGSFEVPLIHFCNTGVTNWHAFSQEIAKQLGYSTAIEPVDSQSYLSDAIRPLYSVLSTEKLQMIYGIEPSNWRVALSEVVRYYSCFLGVPTQSFESAL